MKLFVFTPLPPAPTGIADYSFDLLRELSAASEDWTVEAISPQQPDDASFPIRTPSSFEPGERGLAMYHVGNSEHHDFVYPAALDHPGVVVLHDLVLHHARLDAYLRSPAVRAYRADIGNLEKRRAALQQLDLYRSEVAAAYPERGEEIAEVALRMGGGRLLYTYPLYEPLVSRSLLTLVHGQSAVGEVREHCPEARVERIRMGMSLPTPVTREEARRRLGLPGGLLLASFGLVTPEKRIPTALKALARLVQSGVETTYLLVGGTVDHFDAMAEAERLGVASSVRVLGRVSEEEFYLYAFAADLCLNLRYPSAGETSATLLRLLACGRVVLVTDQLHVSDYPDSVVARSQLEGEDEGLYCDIVDLVRNPNRRRRLEESSRAFVASEHAMETMVTDYLNALEVAREIVSRSPGASDTR